MNPRVYSAAFGWVMVAAAAHQVRGPAIAVALAAAAAVALSVPYRLATTVAVALTVVVIAMADPMAVAVALAGLSAAAYLLTRYGAEVGRPSVLAALGFSAAAVLATWVPVSLPWVPLLAAPAALAIYAMVARPFVDDG